MTTTTTTTENTIATDVEGMGRAIVESARDLVTARRAFVAAVKAAHSAKVWEQTGHRSLADYLADTLKGAKVGNKDDRAFLEGVALALVDADAVSVSTFAAVSGLSRATAARRLSAMQADGTLTLPDTVTGQDGKVYRVTRTEATTKGGSTKGGSTKGGSTKGGSTKGGSTKGGKIATSEQVATLASILTDLNARWESGDALAESALKALATFKVDDADGVARLVARLTAK